MWKLIENKTPKGIQELKVKLMLIDIANYTYATYSEAFESVFKQRIAEIPRTNNFSADLMFKCTTRNLKSVEIWKMTVAGDFKSKMFTLEYIG